MYSTDHTFLVIYLTGDTYNVVNMVSLVIFNKQVRLHISNSSVHGYESLMIE